MVIDTIDLNMEKPAAAFSDVGMGLFGVAALFRTRLFSDFFKRVDVYKLEKRISPRWKQLIAIVLIKIYGHELRTVVLLWSVW